MSFGSLSADRLLIETPMTEKTERANRSARGLGNRDDRLA